MDTQAPPATGARLTPQAVEALIARRLDALGHRPDLLDGGAIAALVADAGGSGRRLRSSLAATLFLASTEDSPQIDAGLVHRALAPAPAAPALAPVRVPVAQQMRAVDLPGPAAAAPAARPGRFPTSRIFLAAALVGLVVVLGDFVLRRPAEAPTPAVVADAPVRKVTGAAVPDNPAPAKPPPTVEAQPSPAQPSPAQPSPAQPSPAQPSSLQALARPDSTRQASAPPALPPMPPPVAVRDLPVPAASQPAAVVEHLPPLPTGAPASIILLYPARDAGALARLRPIAERLQKAGMTDIRARPVHASEPRRVISYFYTEDRPLADAIAKTLDGSVWPRLRGNSLQPSLVLPPVGLPGRNPGTIEVQLP